MARLYISQISAYSAREKPLFSRELADQIPVAVFFCPRHLRVMNLLPTFVVKSNDYANDIYSFRLQVSVLFQ